jgi:hypothetical protein
MPYMVAMPYGIAPTLTTHTKPETLKPACAPPTLTVGPNRRFWIADLPLICPCRDPGTGVSARVNLKSKIDDLVQLGNLVAGVRAALVTEPSSPGGLFGT